MKNIILKGVFLCLYVTRTYSSSVEDLELSFRQVKNEAVVDAIFTDAMSYIKSQNSSPYSKFILKHYADFKKWDGSDVLVAYYAGESGNVDLLEYLKKDFLAIDFNHLVSWEDGTNVLRQLHSGLAVLAKWKCSEADQFYDLYLKSPDVPYERVNIWYTHYDVRGLQGTFVQAIITNNLESKAKIYSLMEDKNTSLSKKRTIIWGMRYDNSTEIIKKLEIIASENTGDLAKDANESLQALLRKKQ